MMEWAIFFAFFAKVNFFIRLYILAKLPMIDHFKKVNEPTLNFNFNKDA